jgi:hypothetical protein
VILAVPVATPVAIPVDNPIVAFVVLLLLHVPPVVESERVDVFPTHSIRLPPIAATPAFTVTTLVTEQPAADV